MIATGDAQPRHVADVHLGHVLHLHPDAVELGENHVLDVVDLKTLGQVRIAAAIEQPNPAYIHGLLAHRNFATADVDVGVPERADNLWDGNVVGVELVQIDVDIVLLGGAAPWIDLDY